MGWTLASITGLLVVFGMYNYNLLTSQFPYEMMTSVTYGGGHRLAWGAALGWVVFACHNGYGGMFYIVIRLCMFVYVCINFLWISNYSIQVMSYTHVVPSSYLYFFSFFFSCCILFAIIICSFNPFQVFILFLESCNFLWCSGLRLGM